MINRLSPYLNKLCVSFVSFSVFVTFSILAADVAHAYYPTMDTGEILKPGHYRLSLEPNVVFNDLNGFNTVAKIDIPASESGNFRWLMGAGAVGYQTGVLYKWVPIPDYEDQPAIGLLGGFIYARNNGINYLNLRAHPLASKKFKTETTGVFTPFVALPFGVTFSDGKTTLPLQLTFGSEWKPENMKYVSFMTELALNLHESYGHVAVSVRVEWDEENGFKFE
jgi:hypothetical protein